MEDAELSPNDDPDVEEATEDNDDLIDLLSADDEIDADQFATVVRPDFVRKAFKALAADAQRGGGTLARTDVNRTYLRRKLSIAECVEIESLILSAGHQIMEDDEDPQMQEGGSVGNGRRRFRYLNETEERDLGRRIQLALNLPEDTTGLDAAYIARVRADADKARATFVAANLRYVHKLARRRGGRKHLAIEDLVQEGVIGLMRATDLYDPERGFRFKTYATWWIEQRIRRAIADGDRLVRLPVHLHDMMTRIRRAQTRLTLANGKSPTPQELADAIGMDAERLMKLLWRVQATDCVEGDAPVGEDTTLLALAADPAESAFDLASYRELQQRFNDVLLTLTPREERVLRMRFGIGLDRDHTLESVGREYSVTRERIRQIEAKALRKLKHFVRRTRLRGFLDS